MASFNKVILMGNLTRDPDVRYTPGGAAVCTLGLAVNRSYTTKSGDQREETLFVDIDVWNRQAENCQRYLTKGAPVLVEGRLQMDEWDDRETGKRRTKLKVQAMTVQFLSGPSRGDFDDGGDGGNQSSGYSRGSGGGSNQGGGGYNRGSGGNDTGGYNRGGGGGRPQSTPPPFNAGGGGSNTSSTNQNDDFGPNDEDGIDDIPF